MQDGFQKAALLTSRMLDVFTSLQGGQPTDKESCTPRAQVTPRLSQG